MTELVQLVKDYDLTMLHLRAGGKFDEPTYRFLKRRANLAIADQPREKP